MTAPVVTQLLREPIATWDLTIYAMVAANADCVADSLLGKRPAGQLWERLAEHGMVHNHGPSEGRGIDCAEKRMPDGRLKGWCLR